MSDELNWVIVSQEVTTGPVCPNQSFTYDLFNTSENEALVYGEREYGINLKWGDPKNSDNVLFQRDTGTSDPIRYGEPVAIKIKNGGFLHNQLRDYGIGLVWREIPCFEWKLMGGNAGDAVQSGSVVALFNTVANDFLFYDPRTYGINLKWLKDKGKYNEPVWSRVAHKVVDELDKHKATIATVGAAFV